MKLAVTPEVWDKLPSKLAPGSHPHSFTCCERNLQSMHNSKRRPNLIAAGEKLQEESAPVCGRRATRLITLLLQEPRQGTGCCIPPIP